MMNLTQFCKAIELRDDDDGESKDNVNENCFVTDYLLAAYIIVLFKSIRIQY